VNLIQLSAPSGTKEISITEGNSDTRIEILDFSEGQENRDSNNFTLVVNVDENSENANVTVFARYETQAKQRKFFTISVYLNGKHQTASIDIRGIADESSVLKFNGGGIVTKKSDQCSVKIIQKIHLFSEKAKAQATPILRVETDNILSASHSASIAPFSGDLFFYMESRGIAKKDAKILLKTGLLQK